MKKQYSEPYKEPKIILEIAKFQGTAFGSLLAVVEYEFKEKFYRRLEKIQLSKQKNSDKWGMGKRKGLSLDDFLTILNRSEEVREALDVSTNSGF